MSIISVIAILFVLGLVLWGARQLGMEAPVYNVLVIFVVVVAVAVLLNAFGLLGVLHQPVPRV